MPPRTIGHWLGHPDPARPGRPGVDGTHPHLAAQLDPDRNPGVDLSTVSAGSTRKLWWRCLAGHTWQAQVRSRAIEGTGCPTCAGRHPAGIATTHPDLAAELDPDHNPGVDPNRPGGAVPNEKTPGGGMFDGAAGPYRDECASYDLVGTPHRL